MDQVIGVMLVIVMIGLLTDKIVFAPIERFLHRRWGTETKVNARYLKVVNGTSVNGNDLAIRNPQLAISHGCHRRFLFMPVGALLVGMSDLQNALFIE